MIPKTGGVLDSNVGGVGGAGAEVSLTTTATAVGETFSVYVGQSEVGLGSQGGTGAGGYFPGRRGRHGRGERRCRFGAAVLVRVFWPVLRGSGSQEGAVPVAAPALATRAVQGVLGRQRSRTAHRTHRERSPAGQAATEVQGAAGTPPGRASASALPAVAERAVTALVGGAVPVAEAGEAATAGEAPGPPTALGRPQEAARVAATATHPTRVARSGPRDPRPSSRSRTTPRLRRNRRRPSATPGPAKPSRLRRISTLRTRSPSR